MADILIWGKVPDLLSGDLPPGVIPTEVDTLAELRQALVPDTLSLVLIDPRRLEQEEAAVGTWAGGDRRAVLVGVSAAAKADALLQRYRFLDDVVAKPVSAVRIERALETVRTRQTALDLEEALARKSRDLHELNKIGVALSGQRDIRKLLELILTMSREITVADAGSLYLVERGADHDHTADDQLRFKWTQNDSVATPFEEFTMPLSETSIAGYAALTGQVVNVADAYELPAESRFRYGRSFDQKSGYRTKSILTVPMRDHTGQVIGVVQLINKKRDAETKLQPVSLVETEVIPFSAVDEELVTSLASQAAVAFENTRLIEDIKNLFNSFVSASVTAIESRDPTTSGHSARVADLTVALAEKMDGLVSGPFAGVTFSRDQIQEIRYASLLHDFGKVGVREKVLIKGKKLYVGEMLVIRQRFAFIQKTLEADYYRARLEAVTQGQDEHELTRLQRAYEVRLAEVDQLLGMVTAANEPSILEEESFRVLMDLTTRSYSDAEGQRQPYLTPNETQALSIRRGSLSEKERREIESHVTHTFRFLAEIPWTGEYRRVPEIAYAHHEKLDGSGYPRKLAGDDIPVQSRMMTIADIFDALVAWDRPYKKAVPVERALGILRDEAGGGKLDARILDLFVDARVYEVGLRQTAAGKG